MIEDFCQILRLDGASVRLVLQHRSLANESLSVSGMKLGEKIIENLHASGVYLADGYFHDHIFVCSDHADKAMAALNELA